MGHLDKRIDADKNATSSDSGRVKDGVSGNTAESAEYQRNKSNDQVRGAAPDVVKKAVRKDSVHKE